MVAAVRPALVLVHGAWHGSWCWEPFIAELAARGWETHTIDLPSASAGGHGCGVHDDARAIRDLVNGIDGPVVLLAHSYGGVPATEAAADAPGVTQLVYLAAFLVEQGESVRTAAGAPPLPADLATVAPPEDSRTAFYADVPAAEADRALARLGTQSARSFNDELTRPAWKSMPTAYVVCEQDQVLPPDFQERMAARASTVHRMPTGHSPFLSRPAELADLLDDITRPTRAARR
jgi:pimeloyl-ACP methyl ester carboxylesterase